MSKSIKAMAVVGLIVLVAACGNRNDDDDVVMVDPVTEEPTYTGKF
ncbi:hypothetical protein [Parasulfitobacter algicola]|uniref:Lipoprotein n=1 Tax=Parasulfitobacter algicola TaxID=2614809 RepID=A0ABX2IZ83_9RHOB|nr:hypothetical protein [Sulfitobacter algicola]NSX56527.1 hypothetical protein [Sulfitobacter algicola]